MFTTTQDPDQVNSVIASAKSLTEYRRWSRDRSRVGLLQHYYTPQQKFKAAQPVKIIRSVRSSIMTDWSGYLSVFTGFLPGLMCNPILFAPCRSTYDSDLDKPTSGVSYGRQKPQSRPRTSPIRGANVIYRLHTPYPHLPASVSTSPSSSSTTPPVHKFEVTKNKYNDLLQGDVQLHSSAFYLILWDLCHNDYAYRTC